MLDTSSNQSRAPRGWSLILCCFLMIGGFFLVTEYTANALGALPYLLVLMCPVMHLIMHRGGHGHHHRPVSETNDEPRS